MFLIYNYFWIIIIIYIIMCKQVLYGIGGAYAGAYLYLFSLKRKGFLRPSDFNIKMFYYIMAGTSSSLILFIAKFKLFPIVLKDSDFLSIFLQLTLSLKLSIKLETFAIT